LGLPNLLVLRVTASESRAQEIIRRAQDGKPGASVKVTLIFQNGGRLTVDFAVRNAAGR
jgi:hypothetical protein